MPGGGRAEAVARAAWQCIAKWQNNVIIMILF